MKILLSVLLFLLSAHFGGTPFLTAEDEEVVIQKVDGRDEALVQVDRKPSSSGKGKVETFEETAVDVAAKPAALVGEGTDKAVQTVRKVGGFSLGNFFRFLDIFRSKDQERKA